MEKNSIYYFSDLELLLILTILKKKNWLGINEVHIDEEKINEDLTNIAIVSLYNKEVLKIEDEKYHFLAPFNTMMRVLQQTKYYYQMKKNVGDESLVTFYPANDYFVIMQRREMDLGNVRVQILNRDSFFEMLEEGMYFPIVVDDSVEVACNAAYKTLQADKNIMEMAEMPNVYSIFEKYSLEKMAFEERMVIEDCNVFGQVYVQSEKEVNTFSLVDKKSFDIVASWLEGK